MNKQQETGQGEAQIDPATIGAGEAGFIVQLHNDLVSICKRLREGADVEKGTVAFHFEKAINYCQAARKELHPMLAADLVMMGVKVKQLTAARNFISPLLASEPKK